MMTSRRMPLGVVVLVGGPRPGERVYPYLAIVYMPCWKTKVAVSQL